MFCPLKGVGVKPGTGFFPTATAAANVTAATSPVLLAWTVIEPAEKLSVAAGLLAPPIWAMVVRLSVLPATVKPKPEAWPVRMLPARLASTALSLASTLTAPPPATVTPSSIWAIVVPVMSFQAPVPLKPMSAAEVPARTIDRSNKDWSPSTSSVPAEPMWTIAPELIRAIVVSFMMLARTEAPRRQWPLESPRN